MTFKAGEQAYIIENNSRVTPVIVVRSYGDFYTVEFGESSINLRASRLYKTRKDAEEKLPKRMKPGNLTRGRMTGYDSPYDYIDFHSPYGI
jgi:hypothetical protein